MEMLKKRNSWLVVGIILIYSTLVWWPTRNLPYHWDSAGFVINSTVDLVNRNFQPWVVEYSDFAHPPLLMTVLGILWKVFGENLLVSHLVMWPFLPILMLATGGLAVAGTWKNKYLEIAAFLSAAMIIATMPVVLSEYGLIYIDLPSSALGVMSVFLASKRKYVASVICLTAGVMIKESALLFWPGLLIFYLGQNYDSWQGCKLKDKIRKNLSLIWIILPILVWGGWLFYHQRETEWLLFRPGRMSPNVPLIDSIGFVLKKILLEQGRIWLWLTGLIGLILVGKKTRRKEFGKQENQLLVAGMVTIVLGILAYAWTREFATRYGIGFLAIGAGVVVNLTGRVYENKEVKRWWTMGLIALFLIFINVFYWKPNVGETKAAEFSPTPDLYYQDMIKIGQLAANYLSENYSEAKVYGSFPEIYQLTQPIQGYVTRPLNFQECKNFQYEKNTTQLIYVHFYSPGMAQCVQIVQKYPSEMIRKFESQGKWLALFKVKADN